MWVPFQEMSRNSLLILFDAEETLQGSILCCKPNYEDGVNLPAQVPEAMFRYLT